jgi:hypothetical protein
MLSIRILLSISIAIVSVNSAAIVSSVSSGVVAGGGWMPIPFGGVPQALGGSRTLPDGTKVCDCFDWTTSGIRRHEETWIKDNAWKMKCNNGSADVVACIGSRRTNFAEIPIGDTLTVNGFWHKCESLDDGQTIRYSEETSCIVNGQELHVNETFRSGTFKMSCQPWGYGIEGCYYYDESSPEPKELAIGESALVGIMKHTCEAVGDVPGQVKYSVEATACEQNGKIYKENETWVDRHLKFQCLPKGAFKAISCVMDNGTELAVGSHVIGNNTVHQCYRLGNTVYYHSFACGFRGVPCAPKTVPTPQTTVVERTISTGGGFPIMSGGIGAGSSQSSVVSGTGGSSSATIGTSQVVIGYPIVWTSLGVYSTGSYRSRQIQVQSSSISGSRTQTSHTEIQG